MGGNFKIAGGVKVSHVASFDGSLVKALGKVRSAQGNIMTAPHVPPPFEFGSF